jgi:hypothetical protein
MVVLMVASVVRLLSVRYYSNLSDGEVMFHKELRKTNRRMLYLDAKYNVYVSSPYHLHQIKHRTMLDEYPAEHTDVTQVYDVTSSNDVRLKTMERKFFPEHETNKNCIPMSDWQLLSFRK